MGKLLRLERAAAPAVQVPGGTHGTFTLFSQAGGAALAADPTAYTMGVQFKVSTVGVNSATLTAVWFNSPGGDGGQDTFNQSAVLTYPLTSFNATNYWVDPEVAT